MAPLHSARPGRRFRALLRRFLCAFALLVPVACGDGGTGPTPRPDPQNPVPAITSLDPGRLLQWSDSVMVTVTGSGFVNGAVVRLNGSARLTTYVSPSQVTAVVPVSHMQQAGTVQVSVFNPAPGGGESGAMALPVEHRVPDLLFLQPDGAMQDTEAFTLSVHGVGFTQSSVVRWNGADRPTTFVDLGRVTAQIPASDLAQPGTAQITVFSPAPGGGTSGPRVFTVAVRPNPPPVVTALSPSTVLVNSDATFTVTGSAFMPGSQVWVGGFTPTTTVVSPTELRFSLVGSNVPQAGTAYLHVTNPAPGGGASNHLQLQVENRVPVLTALSPAQAATGQDSLTVRLTGTGFVAGTEVQINGGPILAHYVSPTELQVVLEPWYVDEPATHRFRALNHAPGGGFSNELTLTLVNPVPVVQAVSPGQAEAGLDSLVVRLSGTGFLRSTQVRLNGSVRPTQYVSPTQVEAVLAAGDLAQPGALVLTATNPLPGGGTSAPATLTLVAPVPVLTLLPSSGASAGRPGFPLMLHGSGFIPSSVGRWNGAARTTRFISSTRLEMDVTSADLASPGTASVTVHTAGVGTSAARQMTVRTVRPMTVTGAVTVPRAASDAVYDSRTDRLYVSVGISPEGVRSSMVIAINPRTGAVTDSVSVGDMPGEMALSDDGTALWVAINGTKQVRRLNLPGLTLGTVFSTAPDQVEDMRVMPGRPGTVAISLQNLCCTPRHEGVAVYDDGVRRPQMTPDHTGSNLIAFGESASVMYGTGEYGGFWTLAVGADGVENVRQSGIDRVGWHMEYAAGRVYTSAGGVIDAQRHVLVGSIPSTAYSVAVDAAMGRAYFADDQLGRVRAYDLNTFQLLGEATVGARFTWSMVRWGVDGLALIGGDSIRIFRTPLAGP